MAEKGVVENGLPPAGKRIKTRLSSMMMAEEDRISKLPDATILHILSFLPTKDVVPTSLLSKQDVERFCKYVDNCLEHRKKGMFFIPDSAITSFKIHVFYSGRIEAGRLDKWLAFAVENKVKEISITFGGKRYYCLPKTVLVNAIYLTILELSKVKLDSRCSFNFPLLKSLIILMWWISFCWVHLRLRNCDYVTVD
ncbi:F-box/FBD/LRR-repeat protein At5g56420-like [Humulus lupulus]|uniref:F-box/FBD/LRR-repeat protein At5g56420-like n=1 Tax=Humulus lupulus TaxID=3486 RepID=UPI002B417936|nr:F-box/FBD/LRR-repeat protein At5g56420-like [Humulus lupulus]